MSTNEQDRGAVLICRCGALLIKIIGLFWLAFIFCKMFNWYVSPIFNLPTLDGWHGYWLSYGIMLCIKLMLSGQWTRNICKDVLDNTDSENVSIVTPVVELGVATLLFLLGLIIHFVFIVA